MIAPTTRWRDHELVVIDVETTGLDPYFDRVVEVAALVVGPDGRKLRAFSSLVNPCRHIPEEATAAHGLRDEDVASAPTFAEVAVELAVVADGAIPVAYNAPFDKPFLAAEYLRIGDRLPDWLKREVEWIDPLTWARAAEPYVKGKGRFKLGVVASRLGIAAGTAHRALGDCETTAGVLRVLGGMGLGRYRFNESPPATLDATIKRQKLIAAQFEVSFLSWLERQPPLPSMG